MSWTVCMWAITAPPGIDWYCPLVIDETYPVDTMRSMELLKTWLSAERGRGVRLAAHLHVPPSFVAKMASGDKSIPLEHASAIERLTAGAITRRDIRPDDWQDIWPELAQSEPNQAPAPANQARVAINSEAKEAAHV